MTEHNAASKKPMRELESRFQKKCPILSKGSDQFAIRYLAFPMGYASWISVVDFEQLRVLQLQLHVEGDRWWLTSQATIKEGKNIVELEDSDPDFEEKLSVQIETVLK